MPPWLVKAIMMMVCATALPISFRYFFIRSISPINGLYTYNTVSKTKDYLGYYRSDNYDEHTGCNSDGLDDVDVKNFVSVMMPTPGTRRPLIRAEKCSLIKRSPRSFTLQTLPSQSRLSLSAVNGRTNITFYLCKRRIILRFHATD